jgi:hypothetical protein
LVSGCRAFFFENPAFFLKISGTIPEFERFGLDGVEVHCRCSAFVANKVRRRRGAPAGFLTAAFSGLARLSGGNLGAGTGFE